MEREFEIENGEVKDNIKINRNVLEWLITRGRPSVDEPKDPCLKCLHYMACADMDTENRMKFMWAEGLCRNFKYKDVTVGIDLSLKEVFK